nr:putative integron gene cassette protein [uncultured bacterium]CAS02603.1 putative integron gene cassette protein [uncultured bacterium]
MSTFMPTVKKLYWLLLSALPFALPLLSITAIERTGCGFFTDCFIEFLPVANMLAIFSAVMAVIIWPVCAWQLGGRQLWQRWRNRPVA